MPDPVDKVKISTLAAANTPEYQFLNEADRAGTPDGGITAQEFQDRLARGSLPAGLTTAKLNGLKASFLNTLAPQADYAGFALGSGAQSVVFSTRLEVEERLSTALFGGTTWASFDVTDQNTGREVAKVERQYRGSETAGVVRNAVGLTGPTLVLRDKRSSDKDTNVIARAKPQIWDSNKPGDVFRKLIHIEDADGNLIGTIRERWVSKAGSVLQRAVFNGTWVTSWEILDRNGVVVAESEKVEIIRPHLKIKAGDRVVAEASRGLLDFSMFGDTWKINVAEPDLIDRRLLIFVAAYKTWHDKKGAQQGAARANSTRTTTPR